MNLKIQFGFHKKSSSKLAIPWGEAVEEALCFGWIDSTKKTIDEDRYKQFYCKRKEKSMWSAINKIKVGELIENGLMTKAGLLIVEKAKKNGQWTLLDEVEKGIIPGDLELEFTKWPNSKDFFLGQSKSIRKGMLVWIVLAKRPETRQKRITEIVEKASRGEKPKQF